MRLLAAFLLIFTTSYSALAADGALNSLSDAEKAGGWILLFDGKSLDHWRGFKKETVPDGWQVQDDGSFARFKGGGDIITKEQYADFELMLEWKISEGGNSGIFYRGTEAKGKIYETAPEMQVLDDAKHRDGKNPKTSAGANYALIACSEKVVKPAGEWNQVKLLVKGNHVEHWLNGVKVVEYELGSPAWQELVANSKFNKWPDYGKAAKGHIGLQDHGNLVWFRNVKIKPL